MNNFQAFAMTGGAHAVRVGAGFLLIKCLAYYLGVEGFGRIGHFLSFMTIVSVLATGGGNALLKYASEFKGNSKSLSEVLNAGKVYICIFSTIAFIFFIVFGKSLSGYIFKSENYYWVFVVVSFAQVLMSISSLFSGLLCGLGYTFDFSKAQILGYICTLPLILFLCSSGNFDLSILSVMLANVGVVFFFGWVVWRKKLIDFKVKKVPLSSLAPFWKFLLMAMVSAFTFPIVEMFIRERLVLGMSFRDVGIWQGGTKISGAYMGFFGTFLLYYFMPKVSKKMSSSQLLIELKNILYVVLPIFFLGIIILLSFRSYFIPLILSGDFSALSSYMPYQSIGDFFKLLSYILGTIVVGKGVTWLYLLGEFVQNFLVITITITLLKMEFSVRTVFVSYALAYAFYFLIALSVFFKYLKHLKRQKDVICC